MKTKYQSWFLFCTSLPLPGIGASVRETIYALETLGTAISSWKQTTEYVVDAGLDTLMDVQNEWQVVVFLHLHKPPPHRYMKASSEDWIETLVGQDER
ncbi:hypothetical protein MUN53_02665 [Parabacteroides sp. AGMB00274]|uniref:Uncharacterized protein n=1 Tax=Parabacteroides faecalis TaxID=2924040 RepID=A0ABT0BXM0_9BACT|nr:hypothetical protein [Parabacteroides faecalis]MCJ2379519.1 hypothetical protein [Parabacteroides faecalis]